jgi:hypothetical protein
MIVLVLLSLVVACRADCVATCNRSFGLCMISGDLDTCRSELDSCLLGCTNAQARVQARVQNLNSNSKAKSGTEARPWTMLAALSSLVVAAVLCVFVHSRKSDDHETRDLAEVHVQDATETTPLLGRPMSRRSTLRCLAILAVAAFASCLTCLLVAKSSSRVPVLSTSPPAPVTLISPCPGCFGQCCPDGVCCPSGICTSLPGMNGQCCPVWSVCYDPLMHQSTCCGFMGSMCVPGKGCRDPDGAALQSCNSDADCWGHNPRCTAGLSIYSSGRTCQK